MTVLQAPLDRACGELPSDAQSFVHLPGRYSKEKLVKSGDLKSLLEQCACTECADLTLFAPRPCSSLEIP